MQVRLHLGSSRACWVCRRPIAPVGEGLVSSSLRYDILLVWDVPDAPTMQRETTMAERERAAASRRRKQRAQRLQGLEATRAPVQVGPREWRAKQSYSRWPDESSGGGCGEEFSAAREGRGGGSDGERADT